MHSRRAAAIRQLAIQGNAPRLAYGIRGGTGTTLKIYGRKVSVPVPDAEIGQQAMKQKAL
jgi:hypothetical protein